jgi:methyl acetate hydrolase
MGAGLDDHAAAWAERPQRLTWGGVFNSYYWIDLARQVAGVVLTQFLPFADPHALALGGALERAVYDTLNAE